MEDEGEQSTQARPVARASRAAHPFVLTVCEGPGAGARLVVDAARPTRVLIGKASSCDLVLADRAVSRRHASVEVASQRLRLRDLGSTNGTVVDGMIAVEVMLVGGELIRIGSSAIRVERGEPVELPAESPATAFGSTLGGSESMRRLYPLCARLAAASVPVVIEGETGVGKEQLAEALHAEGPRREGPFLVFDCTAVAPSLIESELFGHDRGAFTGSTGMHQGVFERAHGGTLLIDEIGDLPLELQPKLLRAIERQQVTRVGGQRALQVDVRILAATRRNLDLEVQRGRFRDDLYHRLAVARIELPPLRERAGDVELLARQFWREIGGDEQALAGELLRRWEDYPWPGNVRELRNAVARRIALGDLADDAAVGAGGAALAAPLSAHLGAVHAVTGKGDSIAAILALELPLVEARQRMIDEFDQRYVERVLERHGGNVTRASAAAGVGRRHLQRMKGGR